LYQCMQCKSKFNIYNGFVFVVGSDEIFYEEEVFID